MAGRAAIFSKIGGESPFVFSLSKAASPGSAKTSSSWEQLALKLRKRKLVVLSWGQMLPQSCATEKCRRPCLPLSVQALRTMKMKTRNEVLLSAFTIWGILAT